MVSFALAIGVGILVVRRRPFAWAGAADAALLVVVAVLVAWRVQGFEPSVRDLAWLGVVPAVTWASSHHRSAALQRSVR